MKELKCKKCGKEYKVERYYLAHVEKCDTKEILEEVFEEDVEVEVFFDAGEELEVELVLENEKHPEYVEPKEDRRRVEVIMDIINYFKVKRPFPKDVETRRIIIGLYNEYYGMNNPLDCEDCEFDDMYSAVWRIYNSHQ